MLRRIFTVHNIFALSAYSTVYKCILILFFTLVFGCKKENSASHIPLSATGELQQTTENQAPVFLKNLDLVYPHANYYSVENNFLQKSNHPLKEIIRYYESVLSKNKFSNLARLEEENGALLQAEREKDSKKEVFSIDIQKLPYAENYLIRIGRSEVNYSSLKK